MRHARSATRPWFALALLLAFVPTPLLAQPPRTTSPSATTAAGSGADAPILRADPSELGLKLPNAEPKPGGNRLVRVKTEDDELVVAKVLAEVGDRYLLILPDGRLSAVPMSETTPTSRPFIGATATEVGAKLTKKFPGFNVQKTSHFIYVYNTSPKFYQGTSRILETMYPGLMTYLKSRKIEVRDPDYPLVVIMFKTRKAWEDYMHGMFAGTGVAAFYDGVSNRVLMYEQSDLAEIAPELALKECISTVAHEGVHQVLHNIGVQQRLSRWPMWISEGLPEYFAPTEISKALTWKGAGKVNDLRMRAMADNIKTRTRPAGSGTTGSLTEWIIAADKIDADGYAWSWALTHFLGERRREPFNKYLTDVTKFAPLEKSDAATRKALFIKHFGDDFAKLDKDLLAHLYSLPYVDPVENMTHYVIMVTTPSQRSYRMTASPGDIDKTRQSLLATIPPAMQNSVQFNVERFPTRTQAQTFARQWLGQ
jgi:hypothetical protein